MMLDYKCWYSIYIKKLNNDFKSLYKLEKRNKIFNLYNF